MTQHPLTPPIAHGPKVEGSVWGAESFSVPPTVVPVLWALMIPMTVSLPGLGLCAGPAGPTRLQGLNPSALVHLKA